MLNLPLISIWKEEELYAMQVEAVTRFMKCDSPQSVEASIELARSLNGKGLNSENYPLALEMLRNENFNVTEALLIDEAPSKYLEKVQPNRYIIDFCFQLLWSYVPGNVYEKTLELIFGVLYRTYHSPKEGFTLYPVSIENMNSLGKFLDKSKKQNDAINRLILNILGDIGEYFSINHENETMEKIAAHAVEIRNAFFDRTVDMNTVIPAELLIRRNYRETAVMPREKVPFKE